MIVTATGSASDSAILPRILNTVLGTRFKVVLGYSSTDSRLAVERGEADGVCGLSWSTLKAAVPHWIQQRLLNVLTQTGAQRQHDLPDVPLVIELVSSPEDRKAIELLSFQQEMGRPFLMPPGTPKEMVSIMRRAFDATVSDPLFLADAEKAFMEVDPMPGEAMEHMSTTLMLCQSRCCSERSSSTAAPSIDGSWSRMPFSTATGPKIYYEVSGEGPAFVFIHANPFDHRLWLYQVAQLSSYFRCVSVDIRGYGRTDPVETPYTLADMKDDVLGVCRTEGIEEAIFCGCSVGSGIALLTGLDHPQMTKAMILVGGNSRGSVNVRKRAEEFSQSKDVPGLIRSFLREVVAPGFPGTPHGRWILSLFEETAHRLSGPASARSCVRAAPAT